MSNDRIAILYKSSAGMGRALAKKIKLERLLRHFGIRYDLVMTRNEAHLRELVRDRAKSYPTIVGAGGDSTFHIILNELVRAGADANFGMIGVGSSNDIPLEFGMDSLLKTCQALKDAHVRKIDLGVVLENGIPLSYFLGQANIGLGAFVNNFVAGLAVRRPALARRQSLAGILGIRQAYRSRRIPLSFVLTSAAVRVEGRAFGSPFARGLYPQASSAEVDLRAMPGALTRDVNTRLSAAEMDPQTKPGAPAGAGVRANTPAPAAAPAAVEGAFVAAVFSNIRYWATGKIINPAARPDDGILNCCLIRSCSFLRLARISAMARTGRHGTAAEVGMCSAPSFEIAAEAPFEVQADGEILRTSDGRTAFHKITVGLMPGRVNLISP
jgi:diacylglycerol kinase family enzyme